MGADISKNIARITVWRIAWTNFFLGFGNEMNEPNRCLISNYLPLPDPFTSGDEVLIYFNCKNIIILEILMNLINTIIY